MLKGCLIAMWSKPTCNFGQVFMRQRMKRMKQEKFSSAVVSAQRNVQNSSILILWFSDVDVVVMQN